MVKAIKKWTELYIKSLPIKNKKYSEMQDNLRIRVYPSGKKTWFFYKQDLKGHRTTSNLGSYPEVSLAKARQMAVVQTSNIYTTGHGIETKVKGVSYKEFIESNHYQSTGKLRDSHKEIMKNLTSKVTGLPNAVQNLPIKAITPTHIENYINKRLKDGSKKGTINKNLTNIRSVFRVAFDKGILRENIMPKVKKLKDDTAQEKLALTDDERKRLLVAADDMTLPQALKRKHMRIFIRLGLDTGLRKRELLTLTWSSFSNPNMNTVENKFQNVLYKFQTPRTLVAENNKGDVLSEDQMIDLYKADKRTLMIMRFYPSIDQELIDHQNIIKLKQRLSKDGYEVGLDPRTTWVVTVPADIAKGRRERKVGVSEEIIVEVMLYLQELYYKSDVKDKKGYRHFWWDDNCNPIYDDMVGDKGNDDRGAGSITGYTDVGFMQDKLLFPQSKLSATGSNKPYKPIKDVKGTFTTIRKAAGLSKAVTPHTLRHAFCTEMAMIGTDMQELMRLAGHRDYKTTMKYIHYAQSMDWSALDKRDKLRKR